MYLPPVFREERIDVLHALMRAHSLATLVAETPSGLSVDHVPLLLDPVQGTLRGHIARANPLGREPASVRRSVAIFQGPEHYISPSWYPSKQEHGKVVPTWNYAVVHAHGTLRIFEDRELLLENVRALTTAHEAGMAEPWSVNDAPPEFIDGLLNGIVGVELKIERLEGKWKVSQNRNAADRAGAAAGLREMAALIEAGR